RTCPLQDVMARHLVLGRIDPIHSFFFSNDAANPEVYTLSLHDALPICAAAGGTGRHPQRGGVVAAPAGGWERRCGCGRHRPAPRSEEHTSELQSRGHLVCRLLLEKKNTTSTPSRPIRAPKKATAGCIAD